ncbi:hypothetical protein ACFQBQ_10180 [Granulicella cerasi]|uniref:DNA ligase n=1 Tax=Granulicella cerasi TaxID=741063 RepID=A0ABW1ZCM1_9BACT
MGSARFHEVSQLAEALSKEASRLKKRAAIAEAMLRVHNGGGDESLALFTRYLAGEPFAEADARKLNAGGAILSRVVKKVSGANDAMLTAAYRKHGDLGAAAFDLLQGEAPSEAGLTLAAVDAAFDAMATARSTAMREAALEALLSQATALEAKYLLKLMLGDMRIGVKASLVEEAVAEAATQADRATTPAEVRHAVMLEADLGCAAVMAFRGTLHEARMRLFHPLGFMLASPVETPEEAVERFTAKPKAAPEPKKRKGRKADDLIADDSAEEALAEAVEAEAAETAPDAETDTPGIHALLEDKFDGMRAQLHFGDPAQPGRVALYSRNREDITESFPELVEAFAQADSTGATILDGEILGWDFATGKALPFATLGQRIGRKRITNETRTRIPVVFMAFDVMFAHDELVLPKPLRERRELLESLAAQLIPQATSPLELDAAVVPAGSSRQPWATTRGSVCCFPMRSRSNPPTRSTAPTPMPATALMKA